MAWPEPLALQLRTGLHMRTADAVRREQPPQENIPVLLEPSTQLLVAQAVARAQQPEPAGARPDLAIAELKHRWQVALLDSPRLHGVVGSAGGCGGTAVEGVRAEPFEPLPPRGEVVLRHSLRQPGGLRGRRGARSCQLRADGKADGPAARPAEPRTADAQNREPRNPRPAGPAARTPFPKTAKNARSKTGGNVQNNQFWSNITGGRELVNPPAEPLI